MGDWERDGRREEGKSNNLQPKSRKGGRLSKAAALKGRRGGGDFIHDLFLLPPLSPIPFPSLLKKGEGHKKSLKIEECGRANPPLGRRLQTNRSPLPPSPNVNRKSWLAQLFLVLSGRRRRRTGRRHFNSSFLFPLGPSPSFLYLPIVRRSSPFSFLLPPKKGVFLPFRVSKKS